jgi:DNA-binding LytR/AlgR family response regulator
MLNPFYFVRKNHLNDDFNMAFNKLKHSYNYKYANYISDNIDILLSRILFFEIDRNNLKIFLNNGEIIEERKTMKKLLNEFENNEHFLLVHNSFLVNMNYISNFSKNIIYIDSYEIPISRSKYTLANKKYITYKMRNDL